MFSQYLWQFAKVPRGDVSTDALVGLLHILTNKREGIGHSQQREQLVLLRLVVKDLGLWLSVGHVWVFRVSLKVVLPFDTRGCGERSNHNKTSISICC